MNEHSGIAGGGSGRPKPTPAIYYYSSLIPRSLVPVTVIVGEEIIRDNICDEPIHSVRNPTSPFITEQESSKSRSKSLLPALRKNSADDLVCVPLISLAYGRSGDKGDVCNIGIIARSPVFYGLIKSALTENVNFFFFFFRYG